MNRPSDTDSSKEGSKEKVAAARERWAETKPGWDQYSQNVGAGLLVTIVLLFLTFNTGTASTTADQGSTIGQELTRLVKKDSLGDPSPNWPQDAKGTLEKRGIARFFAAHTYRLAVQRQNTQVTSAPTDPSLRSLRDTRVQASIRATRSTADGRFGLLCRQRRDRYYMATVDINGEYQIAKASSAGKRTLITGNIPSETAANVLVLELICTGGQAGSPVTLALRINGEQVTTKEDPLEPLLESGRPGLYAETGAVSTDPFAPPEARPSLEVAFEDFMVWTR
jgi:hypothetical protein